MRKKGKARKIERLSERLERTRIDMVCACDCDGRGCTLCKGADVVAKAVSILRRKEDGSG